MIFQHTWTQVLDRTKTQTRRLVKPFDYALNIWGTPMGDDLRIGGLNDNVTIGSVIGASNRPKWTVYRTYAVQPGRGQKAIARIRITGIRREALQAISIGDACAEGLGRDIDPKIFPHLAGVNGWSPTVEYMNLWDSIHTKPGTRWADNPDVWVLCFELVEASA